MEWLLAGSKPQQLFSKSTLILIGLGLFFLILGGGLLWVNYQQPGFCLSDLSDEEGEVLQATESTILVDMEGAVQHPGVYQLDFGAVVLDALEAAGGLSDDADKELIETHLNLAQRVGSGEKLIIPALSDREFELSAIEWCRQYGKVAQAKGKQEGFVGGVGFGGNFSSDAGGVSGDNFGGSPGGGSSGSSVGLVSSAGLISINTADATELESLSGIGEKRAEAIIKNRPYQSIQELVEKKVISGKLLNELSSQLSL